MSSEDEDAKYGALAGLISFGVILVLTAGIGLCLGWWVL